MSIAPPPPPLPPARICGSSDLASLDELCQATLEALGVAPNLCDDGDPERQRWIAACEATLEVGSCGVPELGVCLQISQPFYLASVTATCTDGNGAEQAVSSCILLDSETNGTGTGYGRFVRLSAMPGGFFLSSATKGRADAVPGHDAST